VAEEIRHFTATIPAGTAQAAPVTVNVAMPPRQVTQIEWRVPNGPMGVFGWQVAMGGVKVFPVGSDLFVVANGESGAWPLSDAPDSGAWQVIGYNTGGHPHSVYLTFHCEVPQQAQQLQSLLPAYELMPSSDLSKAGPPVKAH
jgi:hypothetical protein